ncbi:MBL fold metallo-hydrolase [Mesorhizobium sp. M1A.F.Ca.IN.022.07.1.1]|uniref:MBL fold metallo-hydrolase n=1 Tax=unclassified Mesorhizobium TaxID=325217 RepID=UPI000BB07AFB|nr:MULTISPECIES: MBL fold metallo-hydrolase [unclassified Mesorhizobium]TGV91003.1 MBL fold metallo-hydrolase [Mesorhizobium sp. M00.F.Ca.ET.158.01.1.1]WIE93673.1 MBL fold metallo-hydrolase [Mesorhizobium sp. WSM4875]AZO61464.1 MBL fold metallo-hydrolase [Mesorhizobium sp. M1A.F.Ca.IN.022.06.1.1]MCT2577229.1 MBL fold metallo-hydrolase [Mesorhizobium sp. P13.3]MDF3166167.1 MBL fold metallo-hydrolase [Mesorhizobium sp. P16.1]
MDFLVRFWGVRGSISVSGPEFSRYGGNTSCIEMRCGKHMLLFDAGSGLGLAGRAFRASGVTDFELFFTHCHYDHIIGLPAFKPIYDRSVKVRLWSGHLAGRMTTRQMVDEFMRPPWFPAKLDICKASIDCRDFVSGDVLRPREGVVVRTGSLNHPGGCIGYRVEWGGRIVAVITDTEHEPGKLDQAVLDLIEDADLVIYDCTYTEDEMEDRRGNGHSTWQQGVKLCEAAGARGLGLFHHDPTRTDEQLDEIEKLAKARFAGAFAARDGQTLKFPVSLHKKR